MSDPLRTKSVDPSASADGDAERDAKIETLLLAGLDQYFAADYAQAIDIWTRALFLDRNHARARAYIERARRAMAEQQRESEELLHTGVAAFERGEIEAAKQMLTAAVQRGGAHDVALAFLTRIERIHAATPAQREPEAPPSGLTLRPRNLASPRRRSRWVSAGVAVISFVAAVSVFTSWDRIRTWMPPLSAGAQDGLAPMRVVHEPLNVPRSSETALDRAQALAASGRLYDALRAVDLVRPTDPLRGEADALKAAIQRDLLFFHTPPAGAGRTDDASRAKPLTATNP